MKRTRIVATIGPACNSLAAITKLISAGVNVARLNFSHGEYDEHAKYIALIRVVAKKQGRVVSLLQDLSGPKIRVGLLPPQGMVLEEGKTIVFSNDPQRKNGVPFQYLGLPRDVKKGDQILLDDGLMGVEVMSTSAREVTARVVTGGVLLSHKGINVPSASLRVPAITDKDKKDLIFGLAHSVDWVALSFVRDPRDIEHLRELIVKARPHTMPKIIAKIEKHEAIVHLKEIIHGADGIMVARGDLGIEIPAEQVPLIQKRIIRLCLAAGKPVIVATQMLDSMIRNPRPTRAEVSDVANAVLDGTDAVMLSGETASGKYPAQTVEMMRTIIDAVENPSSDDVQTRVQSGAGSDSEDQLGAEIRIATASMRHATVVIIPHNSLAIVPLVARLRTSLILIPHVKTAAEAGMLNLYAGVYPIQARSLTRAGSVAAILKEARARKIISRGDRVILITAAKRSGRLIHVEELAAL